MAFNWNKFPWTNLHDLNLDWIIQKVQEIGNRLDVIENEYANVEGTVITIVNREINELTTGAGDLEIDKSGDVRITATNVVLSGTTISSDGEQLHLRDTSSNTSLTASYRSNVLGLINNQDLNEGVAIHDVKTPADGAGDNSKYAANCGYVKASVNVVSSALATETENRVAGDNALQSTIDSVIMPLLNARGIRDFHVTGTVGADRELTSVTFGSEHPKTELDTLLTASTKVRLVVELPNETRYFNMCYKTATEYGFSGMYKAGDGVSITEMIVYDGTTFAIH